MNPLDSEIIVTLVAGTLLVLMLTGLIIVAVVRYQDRKNKHLLDLERMKIEAEQQLLKTKLEVHEKTLLDVSREIHDNIGQGLAVVKLNLNAIKLEDPKMAARVSTAMDQVNRSITDLRNLSKVLSSDYISKESLSTMLEREADVINKAQTFEMTLKIEGEEPTIPSEKRLIIFRMAQESIQNAIKHSKAKRIQVSLGFPEGQCLLNVEDDGQGFDMGNYIRGNGLTNLQSRATVIKGSLDVKSQLGSGTKISLTVPV
jgi:two-component system, NarL family, sensor kinase